MQRAPRRAHVDDLDRRQARARRRARAGECAARAWHRLRARVALPATRHGAGLRGRALGDARAS
jgi:hypothetical protein